MNKAICVQCLHHLNTMLNPLAPDAWYNQLCKAYPLPREIDPVTGQEMPISSNDLGNTVYRMNNYDFCRNHNKSGDCPDFVAKNHAKQDILAALSGSKSN